MELFNVGDRIEISTLPNETDIYHSMLDSIIDDTCVIVFMPISEWYFIKLSPERDYYLSFFSSATYSQTRFKAKILKYLKKGDFYFITFKLIGEGKRTEKRGFYRFSYSLPFVFYKIGETEGIGVDLNIYYDGVIIDIGAGGIKFISNESVDIDNYISCLMTLNTDQVVTDGIVVGKQSSNDAIYKFEYRVKFEKNQINQDKIIQFIFDEQRKGSKKNPKT